MVIENYTSKKVGIKSLTMKSTSKFLQSKMLTIKCSGYSEVYNCTPPLWRDLVKKFDLEAGT